MALEGEYEPSTWDWVREQVAKIEESGGTEGTSLNGYSVVVITSRGAKTGKLRKNPVIRVERDGKYAAVASVGGMPKNPFWYHNLRANPRVEVRDGEQLREMVAREVTGAEKAEWWNAAVAEFPQYATYQEKTDREIPVFVLEPAG